MNQNLESKSTGQCVSIININTFLVLTSQKQLIQIRLPYVQTQAFNRTQKKSPKSYKIQALVYLINTILNKIVQFTIVEKRKNIFYAFIYLNQLHLLNQLVTRGYLTLDEQIQNQNLIRLQKQAKKLSLGKWSSKNNQQKNVAQLSQKNIESAYQILSKRKTHYCLLQKVQGLKLFLYIIQENYLIISYFSELKIPRINNGDSKKAWSDLQNFIIKSASNRVVKLELQKYEVYKGQVSLYGRIYANNQNLRNKIVQNGYGQLSKNCKQFLNQNQYSVLTKLQRQAKQKGKGLFYVVQQSKPNINISNSSNKIKQYQYWIKDEKKIISLKNANEQLNEILSQYKLDKKEQLNDAKMKKLRLLSQVFCTLLVNNSIKYMNYIKQFNKMSCNLLIHLLNQQILVNKLQSLEYMKLINILMRSVIFFLNQIKDNQAIKKQQNIINQIQKIIKIIFKMVFLGNSVFHQKIFGKLKDLQFQNFSFNVVDYSGLSSYSQISDLQQTNTIKISNKQQNKKKIFDAYLKIRISSSLLLNLIFKGFPIILQNNWQICVKSNIFSEQFNEHIKQLQFKYQGRNLSQKQKQRIINLMRINFGDHSLLSMVIFQQNTKVKLNILNCLINMINNFQGKKTLVSLDLKLIEIQPKSSFIPKSFVIYSAFKNIYYTLLFCLYYQKNIQIILLILKTINQLIQHTLILQKIPFNQGLQILIQNYIFSILKFPQNQIQLVQLKAMSVECISKIVSSNYKWKQLQIKYLEWQKSQWNIPLKLIELLKNNMKNVNWENQKLTIQVNNTFVKIIRNYFSCIITPHNNTTIWSLYKQLFKNVKSNSFTKVIQQICKKSCKINQDDEDQKQIQQLRQQEQHFCSNFMKLQLPQFLIRSQNIQDSQQFINILNLFTFINKNVWEQQYFKRCSEFLLYCFEKYSPIPFQKPLYNIQFKQIAKIQQFKSNILLKVAYAKLLGYMSFIDIFKKQQIMKNVFNILLVNLKSIKGLNTLIKSSWALSNWCNIQNFHDTLNIDELNQLFIYLVDFTKSDKQKVASNGTRGLGMFIKNLPKQKLDLIKKQNNVENVIINNLNHKSVKVSWNCLVAMRSILKSQNFKICQKLFEEQKFFGSLLNNFSRSNYKLQIQTLQTFKCLDRNYISKYIKQILCKLTQIISETNGNITQYEYSFAEFKYINILRKQLIKYYVQILLLIDQKHLDVIVKSNNLYLFLQNLHHYLISKKQKIKQTEKNKQMFEKAASLDIQKQVFNIKDIIFHQQLQIKINQTQYTKHKFEITRQDYDFFNKLKKLSQKLYLQTQKNKDIKLSFSVVDAFQQLSQMQLTQNSVVINLLQF